MTNLNLLEDLATRILRSNGYTWAGNKKTKEFIEQKKFEAACGIKHVHQCGMTKKKSGTICPRIRKK